MKKTILLATILLTLNGCARAYVRAWSENQVTVCGNKFANEEMLRTNAEERCHSKVKVIGGQTVDDGAEASAIGGSVFITNIKNECLVYECRRDK